MNNLTLYGQVRRKLNITWEDEDTTARIEEIIEAAIPTLKYKLGIVADNFDFATAGQENTLFLAYCLYEWNHAVEEFDTNYANEIAQIRMKYEVAYYKEKENENAENEV